MPWPGHSQELFNRIPGTGYDSCQMGKTGSVKLDGEWNRQTTRDAHNTLFLMQFVQQLAFAGTIVDSYQVGKFLGVSPAFSGLLVGLFMAGGGVGTSCMMLVLQSRPSAWKHFRGVVLGCQIMDTLGVVLYTLLIFLAVQTSDSWVASLALVRFAWGLGSGVAGQLAGVTITKITPAHEIPEQMQNLQFFQTLGLGLGPLLAGLSIFSNDLLGLNSHPSKLCVVPLALASVQIISLLTLWQLCPSSLQAWHDDGTLLTRGSQKHSARIQLLFLCSCFLLCALRGYAVAGAEVGTAMLLEVPYGWNRHSIGFLVSGAFLASIPLRSAYFSIKHWFSTVAWIRILSLLAVAGTLFLFSKVNDLMPDGLMLVLADAIMFPSLYLAEGLTRGLMMQFAKDSTVLSANHASFLAIVLNNIARTAAPWLSRKNISTGNPHEGQDLFATSQLLSCMIFLAVFEFAIWHVSEPPVIVIGLPSFNEAENIEAVTKVVDEGCRQHFPNHRCILVNADCQSSDGTAGIFAETRTHCEKVVLKTAWPGQGKGAALRLVFEYMLKVDAEHGFSLDTDVTSITPDWIKRLSLTLKYDFAAPRYARHRFDGFITNLLIYPSVCAVFGFDVRQPIGGDFGFSLRTAKSFLAQPWPPNVEKYGIDIFMTTTALKNGFSIAEVQLPAKVHSPSLPKLKKMFGEVLDVLLTQLRGEEFSQGLYAVPRISSELGEHEIPELKVDPAVLLSLANECFQEHEERIIAATAAWPAFRAALAARVVDCITWARLLHWALTASTTGAMVAGTTETLHCFFFLRAAAHCAEVQHMSNSEAEELVKAQRDQFARLCRETAP